MMSSRALMVTLCFVGICTSPLGAAPLDLIGPDGTDSGWNASWDESVGSIAVLAVDLDASTVRIAIEKDFGPYEGSGDDIEFPDALINFTPDEGGAAVVRIIVESETIANHTGADWSEFHWIVVPTGAAGLLVNESGGWNVAPFAAKTWQDAVGNVAHHLTAHEGTVPDAALFTPAGDLVIEADGRAAFTLKQVVVPEPSCLALLAAGALGLLRRRRRDATSL